MSLPVFGEIEKLIDESGSAAILKERTKLARDGYDALEAERSALAEKLKQLEMENAKLKEKIETLENQIVECQPTRIEETQERILALLAESPRIASDQVAQQLQIDLELSKALLEELKEAQLVIVHHVLLAPSRWSLSQDGHRYLVSNGLLKNQ
jgi:predicted nuclease with TOPRIM domain